MSLNAAVFAQETSLEHISHTYLPLVRSLARRIHRRLPQNVEIDDLISAGMLGLLEASSKFDPGKNIDFSSFAYRRIQGAILDSLRDLDWAPRGLRRRSREIQETIRSLSARLRRSPSEEEVAAELNISLREYQRLLGELASLEIGTLHRKASDESGEEEDLDVPGRSVDDPLFSCLRGELETRLEDAMQALPERERLVVRLYFREEMTRTQIAAVLGIDAIEVGRIRASAILYLRVALTGARRGNRKAPIPMCQTQSQLMARPRLSLKAA